MIHWSAEALKTTIAIHAYRSKKRCLNFDLKVSTEQARRMFTGKAFHTFVLHKRTIYHHNCLYKNVKWHFSKTKINKYNKIKTMPGYEINLIHGGK